MAALDSPGAYPESPLDMGEDMCCKGCGDLLHEGKAFELAGNRWHIDCFRCNTCGTLLDSDANLLLLGDGSLICNACTYSCASCGSKIEDLAILTGDQAFCSSCFRCRNCKKRIENLRYARTSQGIFCMSCHESLMARRRKKAKGTPKQSQNGSISSKEKALPSLPPGALEPRTLSPETETPPSESTSSLPPANPFPERTRQSRHDALFTNIQRDVSPLSEDGRKGGFTSDTKQTPGTTLTGSDGPTLPASTYGDSRPSNVSLESEDGDERGFLPMAFDPNPVSGPPPIARKQVPNLAPQPQRDERPSRDYFGGSLSSRPGTKDSLRPSSSRSVSTEREPSRSTSQTKASPHIFHQDKSRSKKTSENNTPTTTTTSATASPAIGEIQEKSIERLKTQQLDAGPQKPSPTEGFKLQEVPKSRRAGSRSNSTREARSPISPLETTLTDDRFVKNFEQSPRSAGSRSSGVNPFDDPKRKDGNGSITAAAASKQAERPVRGDSLTPGARKGKVTPEVQTPTTITASHERKSSSASNPASFVDAQSTISRDNSRSNQSPPTRRSIDAPPPRASSRNNAVNKVVPTEEFTAPRAPPPPPQASIERHKNSESFGTIDDPLLSPALRSAALPKQSLDGGFSMEEEMARIMRGDSMRKPPSEGTAPSVLRKVSNAVKHGRSFSDRALNSAGKSSSNGAIDIGSPMTISSPLLSSPSGKDNNDQLTAQLRRAQQRIAELESEVNRLEGKVDSSTQIKEANNELREKRTTIVVLDTQREMVVRELEAMTEHLSRVKDSNRPLDWKSLKSDILKDFAESLQKLKDTMSLQIEDLMRKRNDLTEEIGNLIQMKDKGFQEYESLSTKNAQLLEMNKQILGNIQEMYKTNRGTNGPPPSSANGLGIYHPGARVENAGPTEVRNLNLVNIDSSMPNLLQEDAEPATVLTAPQVVNIRKGQPKKFNWRKGGERVAKNVTKGIKGAFVGEREREGQPPYGAIGVPYNSTQAVAGSDPGSNNNSRIGIDAARGGAQAFGFFGQKPGGLKAQGLGNMKDNSSTNLVTAADPSVLFGSDLEARCEFEKRVVPSIVSRCIDEVESRGMDMEGIYRKSGGSGQVKIVQQGFEKDGNYDISDPDLDIHAVTSALKQYFRRLPEPLITYDVYDNLLEAGAVKDKEEQAFALRAAVAELPEHHRDCLEFLIQHLSRVMAQESENLMTPLNLAVVFAPTIMRPQSIEREMSDMQAQRVAVQALLDQNMLVFPDE